jgi:YEATS domain-containing protein 4
MELWLVVGNLAKALEDKSSVNTHRWTCYLRPLTDSSFDSIDRAIFKLHESFNNPSRVFSQPPFELDENGWGEFEIQIKLLFKNSTYKPLVLRHMLKLYPDAFTVIDGNAVIYERIERLILSESEPSAFLVPSELVDREREEYERLKHLIESLD